MKPHVTCIRFALVLAAFAAAAGCSKSQPQKQESESPPPVSGSELPAAEPRVGAETESRDVHEPGETESREAHGPGETGASIVPGANASEIWKQIAAAQAQLEAAIRTGELGRVEGLAFGIRDLAMALGAKTTGLEAKDMETLQDIVVRLRVSASELAEEGEEGAASGVREEYAQFKELLVALKPLTGAH
jgi:hypothetical protein